MPPDPKDMARPWDMLNPARAVVAFTREMRFDDFMKDRRTHNTAEHNLETIGEAARHTSKDTRDGYPDIPGAAIIGLRNIIAHEYGEIRYEKGWSICKGRLPAPIRRIEETGVENPPHIEEEVLSPLTGVRKQ